MNTKRIAYLAASFLLAAGAMPLSGASAADNQCVSCHQNTDFYAQYPKLYEYYQDWLVSPHKKSGATCDDCHGGDPAATSMTQAHSNVLKVSNERSALHYKNQPETCGACHGDKKKQFIQSKHYQALAGQRAAPTCTTCHSAMNRRPDYRIMVLNACRNCHGEGNSEDLPLVSEQAAGVFHQLNVASGFLGWANIYYESRDWPEGSKQRMRDLETRYQTVLDQVHRFDMQQTEAETVEIQEELRAIFDAARSEEEAAKEL